MHKTPSVETWPCWLTLPDKWGQDCDCWCPGYVYVVLIPRHNMTIHENELNLGWQQMKPSVWIIVIMISFLMFLWWKSQVDFLTRQIWGIWKLRPAYSPETPNLGQNRWCFVPCDLETWWMTLENNRASLLCCFKLCATFHSHWWIQLELQSGNAQFGSNSTIFRAVWPWNLTDDLEKQ